MKSFLLSLALGAIGGTAAYGQTQPTIYGSVVFGHLWEDMGDNAPYGVYSLPANNASALSQVKLDNKIKAYGGGVYVDGHYYLVDYTPYETDRTVAFRIFDVEKDWKLVSEKKITTYSSVASDLAYDPTTDKIFGCFRVDPMKDDYYFGTFNPVTGFSSKIANLKEELMAVACNREGKIYGIGRYGMLYSIDKETGTLTEIGQTNKTIKYAQSATFDYASGKMYWAMTPHYTNESPEICEVNLSTGAVTTLTTIPERYEFTGIYTTSSYTEGNAPAAPADFKGDYQNGSLSGNVTFSMPSKTVNGSSMEGDLSYTVKLDEQEIASGKAKVGNAVSLPYTMTRGMHYLKAYVKSQNGRSQNVFYDFWAGRDVVNPGTPKAEKKENGEIVVSWTAPVKGNHDGYYNPGDVSYTVTRQPDNKVVYEGTATSYTDESAKDLQIGNYYYDIKAKVEGEYGETVSTQYIMVGSFLVLPYSQDFENNASVSTFVIEDMNEDGNTWEYFGDSMICGVSESMTENNDWFITPAFYLSKDSIYQVCIDAKTDAEGYKELMQICAGEMDEGSAMTQTILPTTAIENAELKTYSATFVPAKDGVCHIGIHNISKSNEGSYLTIDNLKVTTIGSTKAPATADNVKASAVGAEHRVNISFSAPSKNMIGKALTENIKTITVKRDDATVKTFSNVAPGESCTFEDTPDTDGTVKYTITAANRYGSGASVETSTYVGYDIPAAVTNTKITADDEGNIAVSWNAPTTGIHNGTIDLSNIKYNIGNVDGSSLRNATVTTTEYKEKKTMKEGVQRLAWYTITPETAQGIGLEATTDTLFIGKPYSLPFAESFPKRQMQKGPWCTYNSETAMWDLMQYGSYADASDADMGLAAFSTVTEGSTARLLSPKISLKDSRKPELKFWVYNMMKATHSLRTSIVTPDGKENIISEFVPNDTEIEENGGEWKDYSYDLSAFKQYDYIQLSFTGIGHEPENLVSIVPMYLDQISIDDPLEGNLAIDEISIENDKVCAGDEVSISLGVENKGIQTAEKFKVVLYRNGEAIQTNEYGPLASKDYKDITLTDIPNADVPETSIYKAVVVWDNDEVAEDNATKDAVVSILPGKPYVKEVIATSKDNNASVCLSWSEPPCLDKGNKAETVTEDFESYAPFTISHFGEWTLFDGDEQPTVGIQDGTGNYVQYDNVGAPMAYQIFNPTKAGINTAYFPTHSGNQVAAAFCAGRYNDNDDWLISPEVDGEQTIKFWACSPDASYYGTQEQIEVLYSTTGTEISSFKKIGSSIAIPQQWKEYTADLPAGTRYFAIRCTSRDQYILFLDDITYRKAARDLRLTGYNVYRNDALITATPVTETTYTANYTADKNDVYKVAAVYNIGESHATTANWDSGAGISEMNTAATNASTEVYDLSGRKVSNEKLARGGIYIIRNGKQTRKVYMKD